MIIDKVNITVKAGDGGSGRVSFHREKYVARGGPDGGDGGRGGSIVFYVDENLNSLIHFKYKRKFVAGNGENGKTGNMYGASADDLRIAVPAGTVIKDAATGKVVKDMSSAGDFVCARGGKGGFGNRRYATPSRQAPNFAKAGMPGEGRELTLELKMMADVGLIGYPNVGKTSILQAVSAARPKIANYHFTTLSPNLGVVTVDDDMSFVMADIPGLIEGAAAGAGLGHEFLRHIERCRLLVHVIDASGEEGRDPRAGFEAINAELAAYSGELAGRRQIAALNKCDLLPEGYDKSEIESYFRERDIGCVWISAMTGEGMGELVEKIVRLIPTLPPVRIYESEVDEEPEEGRGRNEVTITVRDNIWFVEGEWLARMMRSVNFYDRESLQYFQRVLRRSGVTDRLEAEGIKDGDTVSIYDMEFEYFK